MRAGGILVIATLQVFCSAAAPPHNGCEGLTPKAIGETLAVAFVHQSEALAKVNLRAKDCRPGPSVDKHTQEWLSSFDKEIDTAAEKIDDASQKECVADDQAYELTHAFFLFRALQQALSSENALVRWNVLERIRWLCENRDLLPDVADQVCDREVEDAALKLLSMDKDRQNRTHALEILGEGYASSKAEPLLRAILASGNDSHEKDLAKLALDRVGVPKRRTKGRP